MESRTDVPPPTATIEHLEQEVRVLRERLAFYEGFDQLIQDNVAHARELFRLAAQEREAASSEIDRAKSDAAKGLEQLRTELEAIGREVGELGRMVDSLSRRIALAVGEPHDAEGRPTPVAANEARAVAVVVHGISSASNALSLQRFVASLPQVAGVTAREFAGGVLRLDARVRDPLRVDQFRSWDMSRPIEPLTERSDVVEFALRDGSG